VNAPHWRAAILRSSASALMPPLDLPEAVGAVIEDTPREETRPERSFSRVEWPFGTLAPMSDEELKELREQAKELREQAKEDRKLIQRAADVLGEIHRGPGLMDEHADVLAALRIRIEGKPRASLEEVLAAAGDLGPKKKDLGDVLGQADDKGAGDWPVIEEKKRDWPSL
jgi:hypothetical protein